MHLNKRRCESTYSATLISLAKKQVLAGGRGAAVRTASERNIRDDKLTMSNAQESKALIKYALFTWSIDLEKKQYHSQFAVQLLLWSILGSMKVLPVHIAVDHNHRRFGNNSSE